MRSPGAAGGAGVELPGSPGSCRLCGEEAPPAAVPLFSDATDAAKPELADRIFVVTQVSLARRPGLPGLLCGSCLCDFELAERFRLRCVESEANLLRSLRDDGDSFPANPPIKLEVNALNSLERTEHEPAIDTNEYFDNCDAEVGVKPLSTEREDGCVCQKCGKKLKTKASLERHEVSMHKKRQYPGRITGHGDNKLYHCEKCEYSTRHSQSLVYHVRRHTGERPHHCDCGATFTQPSSLAAHRKKHSDLTYYTCAECGSQFKYKDSYERHKGVHSTVTLSCTVCGKGLKTRKTLENHMNRHLGLKNYSCEKCGVAFVTTSELLNHKKKHDSKAKDKYQCHLCEYKSYLKKALDVHLKRHTGERSFKCKLCSYDTYTQNELRTHHRSHTKEKKYPCPNCGQKFTYSSSLNKHVLRAHNFKFVWNSVVDRRTVKTVLS